MKTKHTIYFAIAFLLPSFLLAFSLGQSTFKDIIDEILSIINTLIPIIISLAFIVFFWGLSKFILGSNNQADINKGKQYMLWGIIAIFIMLTFKTIISLVATDLGIGDGTTIPIIDKGAIPQTGGQIINNP